MCPARLFIISGEELLSNVGTTEGDPTSMGAYALGILPLLQFLLDFISINELNTKEGASADEYRVAGKLSSIKHYWIQLTSTSPKYDYFLKASKSYLIVKEISYLMRLRYLIIQI